MSVPARAPERKVTKSVSKRIPLLQFATTTESSKASNNPNSGCFSKIRFTYNFQVKVGFRVSIKRLHRCYKAFERFRVSKLSPYREFKASLFLCIFHTKKLVWHCYLYWVFGMALISILGIKIDWKQIVQHSGGPAFCHDKANT